MNYNDQRFYFEFGQWVASRRREMGITQTALSKLSGVGRQTIRKIEVEGNQCFALTLFKLSMSLGLDIKKLTNMVAQ